MSVLSDMLSSAVVQRLGWTLLHSVWQFALIAVLLSALLATLRRRSANTRYLIACIGLVAMLTTSTATYWRLVACQTAEAVMTTVAGGAPPAERVDVRDEVVPDVFTEAPSFVSPELPDNAPSTAFAPEPTIVGSDDTSSDEASATPATLPRRIIEGLAPWLPWVSLAWLGGVILVSVRHLGGWFGVQRLRWAGTTEVDSDLGDHAHQLMNRMKISRPVRILQSSLAELPIVVGWLRPVVVLPAGLLTGLSPRQLEAILAHELAHVRRYDYLINLLQTAIETLLFYHPAVWWLSRRIRIEREHCCDDVAVAVCGNNVDYAEALAAVEQRRAAALAMAIGGRGRVGSALVRVRRVLDIAHEDRPHRTKALGAGLIGLTLVVALVGYLAIAGEDVEGRRPAHSSDSDGEVHNSSSPRPETRRESKDIAWGEAKEGIRIGLSPRTIQLGAKEDDFKLRVHYENVGDKPLAIPDHGEDPPISLIFAAKQEGKDTVTHGRRFTQHSYAPPSTRKLAPGQQYSEVVQGTDTHNAMMQLGILAVPEIMPGTSLSVRVGWSPKPGPAVHELWQDPHTRTSGEVTISREAIEWPWGESVEGVQIRLRPTRRHWLEKEVPWFQADIRNSGSRKLSVVPMQEPWRVIVDGREYHWASLYTLKTLELGPGGQFTDVPISLVETWQELRVVDNRAENLVLSRGKHTIQVAYVAQPWTGDGGTPVRAVSNPVEFFVHTDYTGGRPVKNLQLQLAIPDQTTTIVEGWDAFSAFQGNCQRRKLQVRFRNEGSEPIKIDLYLLARCHLSFEVTGPTANSAKTKRHLIPWTLARPLPEDFRTLERGQMWTTLVQFPGVFRGEAYGLLEPGEYRLRAVYENGPDSLKIPGSDKSYVSRDYLRTTLGEDYEGCWEGTVKSNQVVVKVEASDESASETPSERDEADAARTPKDSAASLVEFRVAEELVDKIVSAEFKPSQMHPLDFSWSVGGGMVVNDFGYHHAMMVQNWERHATSDERMDADVKKLIAMGPDVADLINRKLRDVPPEHPAAARLSLALRSVGNRDSVPSLIDLMQRATAKTEDWNLSFARQTTLLACTSALWQITGRPFCHAPDAWQRWWNAVQDIFLPARDRKNRGVDELQVLPLVRQLAGDPYAARERLIVLGPNAVPHLRGALDATSGPTRMEVVWVMDELNATGQIPAELRRSYFIDRLERQVEPSSFHLPIHERACLRCVHHCSFADFCRIAIEVDRKHGQRGAHGEMWGWVKMNSRLFRRLFGTVTPGARRVWADVEPLEGTADSVAEAVPVLIEALDRTDYASRKAASELAAMIGFTSHEKPEALIQKLEREWLKEENEHLRRDIGLAMVRFQTPEVRAAVKRGLWSDVAEIAGDSAGLVDWVDMRPASRFPEIYDRLVELTSHDDDRVRSNSVRTLRYHAGQRLIPHLKRLCKEQRDDIRVECSIVMGEHPSEDFVDLLVELANDPSQRVRERALSDLGQTPYRKAVPKLAPLLKDEKVWGHAVAAIADAGRKDALPLLFKELESGNDVGGMIYQHLRRLTGQKIQSKPEPWLEWWRKQTDPTP